MRPIPPPDYILPLLDGVRRAGGGWIARCPAHDDDRQSLSISEGEDGKTLLHCFKGCDFLEVAAAIRELIEASNSDIFGPVEGDGPAKERLAEVRLRQGVDADPSAENGSGDSGLGEPTAGELVGAGGNSAGHRSGGDVHGNPPEAAGDPHNIAAVYDYKDQEGRLIYQVIRFTPKGFARKYAEGAAKVSTLYRLPDLSQAPASRAVFVVEGEKDADNLAALGLVVTTSGGATSWRDEYADLLAGRRVIIIPDNDAAGRAYAAAIAKSCLKKAVSIRTVNLPVPPGGDVSDWLAAGHTKQELFDAIARTQEYPPRRWKPMDLSEAKIPPVEGFLNGRIFCRQSVGMIAGRRGVGKTAILMKLMYSIALGYQFGPYPTRPGKVLLLSQEMTDTEIQDRLNMMFTRGERLAINDAVTIICRDTFTIDSDKNTAYLASIVEEIRPDVVLIDALADIKGSAVKENDNDLMGDAARRVKESVAIPFNCCVIITHHTGRQKEDGSSNPRGGIAFEDVTADIMFLDRKKDGSCTVVLFDPPNGKVRHGGVPKPFGYTISSSDDGGRLELEFIEDLELAGDRDGLIRRIVEYITKEGAAGLEPLSQHLVVSKAALKEALKSACALGLLVRGGSGAMTTWSLPVVM